MSDVDIGYLRQWVGRTESCSDVLSVRHARLMAATLGISGELFQEGSVLPPLWHWLFFLEGLPPSELGRDGHPVRGGFLPPVPLANRMWAGGTLKFAKPVLLGSTLEKRSSIKSVEHKYGRSGELVFVTVLHEILHDCEIAICETHDIVYKQAGSTVKRVESTEILVPHYIKKTRPDATMLFRYSALTFNGHRIHYDADYCRQVEGYSNVVIHGPLCATLLASFAEEVEGRPLKTFRYRGIQPSVLGADLTINAKKNANDDEMILWTALPDNAISMKAEAHF